MAYNEKLSDRIREALTLVSGIDLEQMEEKHMFGGVCYMVNGKMCIGVVKDEMMCRIDPDKEEEALEKHGCRPMDFTGRPMKGYVYVSEEALRNPKDWEYWLALCLSFNAKAKASVKKSKRKGPSL